MKWDTIGIAAAAIVVTFVLTWLWRDSVHRADLAEADDDTTNTVDVVNVPPYTSQGYIQGTPTDPSPPETLTVYRTVKDSAVAAYSSCERDVLLNTIGRLNMELCAVKDTLRWERGPQSFQEDSLRYRLAVTFDPSLPIDQRWWRWLEIKGSQYSDTTTTITKTVLTASKLDWPWLVAVFAVGMTVMALLYSIAFK